MENDIVIVKQLPIIEEQLIAVKDKFLAETEAAKSLVCTEDTIPVIKKKRAELTRIYKDLEGRRKTVKKLIMAPYENFEKHYKECVTDIYTPCDKQLAGAISEIENAVKEEKRKTVETFFSDYCKTLDIDFITFDRLGLNIILSTSIKNYTEQVKIYLDRVADEIKMIDTQEYRDEVLVEYKKSLNISQSIVTVHERHKAIDEEAKKHKPVEVKIPEEDLLPPDMFDEKPEEERTNLYKLSLSCTEEEYMAVTDYMINHNIEYTEE